MIRRWVNKSIPEVSKIQHLSSAININEVLAAILIQRQITNYQEAKDFFRPSLHHLHDPFLMKDMDKAVVRLEKAIACSEKILVYGDYDVDGTTSVVMFYGFLKEIYDNIDFYIPDRYNEGYGISSQGIAWARANGFDLIVSLDCGVKALNRVAEANSYGIDFIICDHHQPGEELPPAYAVLDPKRADCSYPFDELSGCGVGFKLLQAYCLKNQLAPERLYDYLDLLAVSIASDIVPITGENRIFTYFGLKKLNENPRPGLQALIKIGALKNEINISSIVFCIGPRINAAGRIEHAKAAVHLLLSQTLEQAEQLALQINKNNTIRRDFDSTITDEALQMIEEDVLLKEAKSTVLFKNNWHKGVIGIVASRCIEKYYRPTIILTESNNKATGSARSVLGFDVYKAISECSDLLEQFGGHRYAAGLTMDIKNITDFQQKFEEVVAKTITKEQLIPLIDVDITVRLDSLNFRFYNILKQMGPFGPGNMHPVFVSEEVYVAGRATIIKGEHIKFFVKQKDAAVKFCAIGFGMAKYYEMINSGMRFNMAYTVEENNYRGNKTLQLTIKDIKFD